MVTVTVMVMVTVTVMVTVRVTVMVTVRVMMDWQIMDGVLFFFWLAGILWFLADMGD